MLFDFRLVLSDSVGEFDAFALGFFDHGDPSALALRAISFFCAAAAATAASPLTSSNRRLPPTV